MIDILKKGILIGIGFGVTSKTKFEELLKTVMDDTKMSEEEGRKFVNSLLEQSEVAEKNMDAKIALHIKRIIEEMNIPSREEMNSHISIIEELNIKISNLKEEIAKKK